MQPLRFTDLRLTTSSTLKLIRLALLIGATLSSPAWASDGVIEINAVAAAAGGITPGDAPGYPVTISTSGSYRLTSALQNANPAVATIQITASETSLDLNGFTISGGTAKVGASCVPNGGDGIQGSGAGISVRNGRVRNHADGIDLGEGAVVDGVIAQSNCGFGIKVGLGGSVLHSIARSNSAGIQGGANSRVESSIAFANETGGVELVNGILTHSISAEAGAGGSGVEFTGVSVDTDNGVVTTSVIAENTGPGIRASNLPVLVRYNVLWANDFYGLVGSAKVSSGGNIYQANQFGAASNGLTISCDLINGVKVCPAVHP
ncbi:hypothetical protein K2X89_13300 [Myxococcota bacterium]|nr:hypothetical protein [Myxococcota bacterium]